MPTNRAAAAPTGAPSGISISDAVLTWFVAWLFGAVLSSVVLSGSGAKHLADAGAGWLAAAQIAAWVPLVAAIAFVSQRRATGSLVADYGMSFRPLDLVGIPIGVATQLLLVRGLYAVLERLWPHSFDMDKVEQPARDIWNNAHGAGVIIVVLVVTVGAPLVEELTYRGLLQGAFTRCTDAVTGVGVVAVWFAVIHFQPVNIPGLLVVGLVLGICAHRSRRLGMSVLTHMAFNATGLLLVAHS